MYLHLGQDVVVRSEDIIGIFDLEKTSLSKKTKDFLSYAAKNNDVVTVSYEMPKSFIVAVQDGKTKIYISQISTATLKKRAEVGRRSGITAGAADR